MDVESNRSGSTQEEAERVESSPSLNPERNGVDPDRPSLDSKHKNVRRLYRRKRAPIRRTSWSKGWIVHCDLRERVARDPGFALRELLEFEEQAVVVVDCVDSVLTTPDLE